MIMIHSIEIHDFQRKKCHLGRNSIEREETNL